MPALVDKIRALFRGKGQDKAIISVHSDRIVVVLSILSVFLLGLPLWWTTTRVYRADLPSTQIAQYTHSDVLEIPFNFYVDSPRISPETVQGLVDAKLAKSRLPYRSDKLQVAFTAQVQHGPAPDLPGHYTVETREEGGVAIVGTGRSMQIPVTTTTDANEAAAKWIARIVGKEEREVRAAEGRALKYSPEYAVTFTLINEDPTGGLSVDWKIEQALAVYLQPFIDTVSPLTKLSVSSQVLHHAGPLPVTPQRAANHTYLTTDALPHFINSAGWNLASTDPVSPMLNFILFVPKRDSQPLLILDDHRTQSNTNAFLIPQWGGIAVANFPESAHGHVMISQADLQAYMGIFIAQLRQLLGVRSDTPLPSVKDRVIVQRATATGISGWEFDAQARRWLANNRQTAVTTLSSLITLVESMQNMVVMDNIKDQVDASLAALAKISRARIAVDHARACQDAIVAATKAEGAFFDPSMVSMLYFPDQHKYAIYLPFFLPVAIPLFHALKRVAKDVVAKRKTKTE
ncbi:GPI transamidase component [Linderina macrospora]|uniref:GPI transamidase component n=1 Tax=Linderina macrospora TaxID=4868 RepID=A0ACC1JCV9_9FUNG|nr:GPI transamidase component [Linderina macrospora]